MRGRAHLGATQFRLTMDLKRNRVPDGLAGCRTQVSLAALRARLSSEQAPAADRKLLHRPSRATSCRVGWGGEVGSGVEGQAHTRAGRCRAVAPVSSLLPASAHGKHNRWLGCTLAPDVDNRRRVCAATLTERVTCWLTRFRFGPAGRAGAMRQMLGPLSAGCRSSLAVLHQGQL